LLLSRLNARFTTLQSYDQNACALSRRRTREVRQGPTHNPRRCRSATWRGTRRATCPRSWRARCRRTAPRPACRSRRSITRCRRAARSVPASADAPRRSACWPCPAVTTRSSPLMPAQCVTSCPPAKGIAGRGAFGACTGHDALMHKMQHTHNGALLVQMYIEPHTQCQADAHSPAHQWF